MIYAVVFLVAVIAFFILFFKWMFEKPVKTYYTIQKEADANGVEIFKLYITKDNGGQQYIGKFNDLETAKAKIASLKEKAAKDKENLLKHTTVTEMYREEM